MLDRREDFANPDYPLHVPMHRAAVTVLTGVPAPTSTLCLQCITLLAILALVYGVVRNVAGVRAGLAAASWVAVMPGVTERLPSLYADLTLCLFVTAALSLLLRFLRTGDPALLTGAALAAAAAAWTKNEGALLLVAIGITGGIACVRRGEARTALRLWPLALVVPWFVLRRWLSLSAGQLSGDFVGIGVVLERLPDVFDAAVSEATGIRWLGAWLVLTAAVLARGARAAGTGIRSTLLAVAIVALGYAAVFVITPEDHLWLMQTTRGRLALHVTPFVAALGTTLVAALFRSDR